MLAALEVRSQIIDIAQTIIAQTIINLFEMIAFIRCAVIW